MRVSRRRPWLSGFLQLMDYRPEVAPLEGRILPSVFNLPLLSVTGHELSSLVTGDFNGDSRLDVITTSASDSMSVLTGRADGTFDFPSNVPLGYGLQAQSSIAAADFNSDGQLDVAITTIKRPVIKVFLGRDGTFAAIIDLQAGMETDAFATIRVGDVNGDGRPDIIAANISTAQLTVLLSNGDGTFAEPLSSSAGPVGSKDPTDYTLGDFNGDGLLDAAVTHYENDSVEVLLGNGDATFGPPTSVVSGIHSNNVNVGDFDGDGRLDLVISEEQADCVGVLLGRGDGSFGALREYAAGDNPTRIEVGDFNNDGRPDLAVIDHGDDGLSILTNRGGGVFSITSHVPTPPVLISLRLGDFNGDGNLDVVTANVTSDVVTALLGQGDGTLAYSVSSIPPSLKPESETSGDFNEDGILDLAILDSSLNQISILLGTGSGAFSLATAIPNDGYTSAFVTADFNRDGHLDLAKPSFISPPGLTDIVNTEMHVLLGQGDGTFAGALKYPFDIGANAQLVPADFNDDGWTDLVSFDRSFVNCILLLNTGGTFTRGQSIASPHTSGVAVGDLNGDGQTDLAASSSGGVLVFLGQGDGTFESPSVADNLIHTRSINLGDFNSDGQNDLAVTSDSGRLTILLGNGGGSFRQSETTPAPEKFVGVLVNPVLVGDFNDDGQLDISVAGNLWLGHGDGTFNAPLSYYIRGPLLGSTAGDFNRDGQLDLAIGFNILLNGARFSSQSIYATGADAGGGPDVKVFTAGTGQQINSFFAYDARFTGGVRVTVGDVNGDGIIDTVTAAGPGGGPDVHVYNGLDGKLLRQFYAFGSDFAGGLFVACSDTNGDGFADVLIGADAGGGANVAVFDGRSIASGRPIAPLLNFFPYGPNFTGGVRVAAGDVDGDGRADLICGAGPGGGPNVSIINVADGTLLRSFFAYDIAFTGGIDVAAGDVDGDGRADIITGAGPGGGPNVSIFGSAEGTGLLASFFAYDPRFPGGVRVGTVSRTGVGPVDILMAAGPGGGPDVRLVDGRTLRQLDQFFAYSPLFAAGLFVAGSTP